MSQSLTFLQLRGSMRARQLRLASHLAMMKTLLSPRHHHLGSRRASSLLPRNPKPILYLLSRGALKGACLGLKRCVFSHSVAYPCSLFAVLQEVNLLVKAIKEFGFGSWAKMKSKYKFSSPDRSEVQLKDKARNLVKSGKHTVGDERSL